MTPGLRYAVVLAFVATPVLAADVKYEVALRSDVLARTPLGGDLGKTLTGDLQLAPRGLVSLGVDTSTFTLLYEPTILWREPLQGARTDGASVVPLHRARIGFDTRWQRGAFSITEDAAYGEAWVGALRNSVVAAEPVTEVQSGLVPYLLSSTVVGLQSRPNDRFTLGVSAGYQVSGSTDPLPPAPEDPAQLPTAPTLPLQYGPFALASGRATVSRLDGLTTTAQVSQAHFITGADQLVAQLRETWDRQLSRTMLFTLGAGAALAREELVANTLSPIAGTFIDLLPVAHAGLDWRDVLAGHPVRLDAALRMAPFADRFTGNVYERVELRGHGEWRFAKDWLTTAAVGGAIAVPVSLAIARPPGAATGDTQAGDRVLYAEGTVVWTVKTWLLLQATARVLWTEQPRTGLPGLVQAAGTVSVTVLQQDSLAF